MHSSNTLHQGCDGELCDIWEGDYPMLSSQNNCQLWIFQQRIFVGCSEFWWLSQFQLGTPRFPVVFSISKGLLPPCHMRSSESSIFRLRKSWPAPGAETRALQNPRIRRLTPNNTVYTSSYCPWEWSYTCLVSTRLYHHNAVQARDYSLKASMVGSPLWPPKLFHMATAAELTVLLHHVHLATPLNAPSADGLLLGRNSRSFCTKSMSCSSTLRAKVTDGVVEIPSGKVT